MAGLGHVSVFWIDILAQFFVISVMSSRHDKEWKEAHRALSLLDSIIRGTDVDDSVVNLQM
jgi:hypothetical protein